MYAVIDIETTGLNRFEDEITMIGVGVYEDLEDVGKILVQSNRSIKPNPMCSPPLLP